MFDQPHKNLMRHTESLRKDKRAWILLLGGLTATAVVGTVSGMQVPSSSSHVQTKAQGPEQPDQIMRMVQELKNLETVSPDAMQIEAKMSELRELLNTEFTRMHEQLAAEIESTENRLAALKKLHEQRGEKQDEIVQRRIDQLLGKTNPLDWNINSPKIAEPTADPRFAGPPLRLTPLHETDPFDQGRHAGYAPAADSAPNSDSRDQSQRNHLTRNDIFTVIGQANEAHLTELSTKLNLENTQRLVDKNILTSLELRKATIEHAAAQNAAAVLKLQLADMQRTFQREFDEARRQLNSKVELMQANEKDGSASWKRKVRTELNEVQRRFDDVKETLSEFEKALRLVPFMSNAEDASFEEAKPAEDQQSAMGTDETTRAEESASANAEQ